ncbi:hypothetical protein LEMLEM_LOCUS7824 [Lemmus lemmus]
MVLCGSNRITKTVWSRVPHYVPCPTICIGTLMYILCHYILSRCWILSSFSSTVSVCTPP